MNRVLARRPKTGRHDMRRVHTALAISLLLTGCVSTNVGKSRYPESPSGFVAQPSYGTSLETTWRTVLTTLSHEGIPVASSDRSAGRIVTEPVDGEGKMHIGILGAASYITRYRFTIAVSRQAGRTMVRPMVTLESSEAGQGQWLNVTRDYPKEVRGIEQWLLAKIEASLPR